MGKIVYINACVDLIGHLRYGHYEGSVELTDEEYELFKKDPEEAIDRFALLDDCSLVVDDWEVEGSGSIYDITSKVVKDYIPICPAETTDCIHDPARYKDKDPDYYKCLYGNKTPEEALKDFCLKHCYNEDDGECHYYDNEDK